MRIQIQYVRNIYLFQFSDASTDTGHHDLNKRKNISERIRNLLLRERNINC